MLLNLNSTFLLKGYTTLHTKCQEIWDISPLHSLSPRDPSYSHRSATRQVIFIVLILLLSSMVRI